MFRKYMKRVLPVKLKDALKILITKRAFKKGRIKRLVPEELYFAVNNTCNANCVFCAYQYNETPKNTMTFEIFKKALDEYVELGGKQINLTPLAGEPLADSNLFEKIKYAKNNKKIEKVYFSSNAILLNKSENYKKIIDSQTDTLQISSPGLDDSAYKRVYRTNQYPQVIKGIKNLLEYKIETKSKIKIGLSFRIDRPHEVVMQDEGMKQLESYIQEGLIDIDPVGYIAMDDWCGHIKNEDLPGIMHIKDISSHKPNIPCGRLITDLAILPNGLVRLCGCRYFETEIDDLVIGDINTQHLRDILASERCKKIIDNTFEGIWPKACEKCSYYGAWAQI